MKHKQWIPLTFLSGLLLCGFAHVAVASGVHQSVQMAHLPDVSVMNFQSDAVFLPHAAQFRPQATGILSKAVQMIKKADKHLQIYVSAYSDDVPNALERTAMTSAQAEAVAHYLWTQGVAADRMVVRGMGHKNPIGEVHSSIGNALNRRVEVVLVPAVAPQLVYPFKE